MKPLLPPDKSWSRRGWRARWSAALTLVLTLAAGLGLAWKEGWFTPVARFHLIAPSSKSLRKGMPLRLSGFKVGQVERLELQADRTVRVELAIFRQYLPFVRADSEVRLESDLPLGDASLELVGGGGDTPLAPSGGALRYRAQPPSYDRLLGLAEKLGPLVDNLSAFVADARRPDGELQAALRQAAETSGRLHAWVPGFLGRADATVAALQRAARTADDAFGQLTRPEGDLPIALRELRMATAGVREALPPLMLDLKSLSASLLSTAEKIGPSLGEFAPKLPRLVEEAQRAAVNANDVLDAVQDFGLIKRRINSPPPPPALLVLNGCAAPGSRPPEALRAAARQARAAEADYLADRPSRAVAGWREVARLQLSVGDQAAVTRSWANLALAQRAAGDPGGARETAARLRGLSSATLELQGDHRKTSGSEAGVAASWIEALLALDGGDLSAARLLLPTLPPDLARESPWRGRVGCLRAEIALREEDFAGALAQAKEAGRACRASLDRSEEARAHRLAGAAQARLGNWPGARTDYAAAVELERSLGAGARLAGDLEQLAAACENAGDRLAAERHRAQARAITGAL